MNKTFTLMIALMVLSLSSCDRNKNSDLIFFNSMESSIGWNVNQVPNNYPIIKFDNAFSGQYVCKLDSTNPFSITFYMKQKDICKKKLSLVRLSAWFMIIADNSEQNLVTEIRDSNEKVLEWIVKDAKDFEPEINNWRKVSITIDLTLNERNNPENYVRIYASNGKAFPVFVDDIKIEFE
jgi:hypothetical protein